MLEALRNCGAQGEMHGIDNNVIARGTIDARENEPEHQATFEDTTFHQLDIFEAICRDNEAPTESDLRIYCRPPALASRSRFTGNKEQAEALARTTTHTMDAFQSNEWLYVCACIHLMGPRGRAIVQMPFNLLNSANGEKGRRSILALNVVKQIIVLPAALSQYGERVNDVLLVLEHNSYQVEYINAEILFEHCPTEERDVINHYVVRPLAAKKRVLEYESLLECPCLLLPFHKLLSNNNPQTMFVRLEDQANRIFSGIPRAQLNRLLGKHAKELSIEEPGHMFAYVTLGGLIDGQILPASKLEQNLVKSEHLNIKAVHKHCRRTGSSLVQLINTNVVNLLVSRSGKPFKSILLLPSQHEQLLEMMPALNDGIICIEFPPEAERSPLPYYLLAFFQSKAGRELLSVISMGPKVSQLACGDLRNTYIPLPCSATQKEIAHEYCKLQKKLEEALETSRNMAQCKLDLLGEEEYEDDSDA